MPQFSKSFIRPRQLALLVLLSISSISMARASQYSEFWAWFQANEADFPSTEDFDEAYGTELSRRLTEIQSGLVYEIAIPDEGEKEFIISADGVKELIPSVQDLVESAPSLEGWTIIAFRPRMEDYAGFRLRFGEHEFDPKKLWCWSRIEDGRFDLVVYHPDYSDEMRTLLINGTYILLDMALGEYDVMTGIRYIDHRDLPDDPQSAGLYQFEDLRATFDEYKSKTIN